VEPGEKMKQIFGWGGEVCPHIIPKLDSIEMNNKFELRVDSVFKSEVLHFWRERPAHSIGLAFKRILFLWTIDIYTERARDPKYAIFIVSTLLMSILGINYIRKYWNKDIRNRYSISLIVTFLLLYSVLIFMVNLETRYQIYIYSIFVLFTGFGIEFILNKSSKFLKIKT
jgi:hypothetical protein